MCAHRFHQRLNGVLIFVVLVCPCVVNGCGMPHSVRSPERISEFACDGGNWVARVVEYPDVTSVQLAFAPDSDRVSTTGTLVFNVRAVDAIEVEWEACETLLIRSKRDYAPDAVRLQVVKLFDVTIKYTVDMAP